MSCQIETRIKPPSIQVSARKPLPYQCHTGYADNLKFSEALQPVIRHLMLLQTLSFGYRIPFFNKQGTFYESIWKNEQKPQNYEYLLSTSQHQKTNQAPEWDTTEDQEEVDNQTFL